MSERNDDREQQGDDSEAYERALQRENQDLLGDMEQDRNLSGSSTYETLPDQEEEDDEG
jgi:hypothetical protein